jgi:hypothetical protein
VPNAHRPSSQPALSSQPRECPGSRTLSAQRSSPIVAACSLRRAQGPGGLRKPKLRDPEPCCLSLVPGSLSPQGGRAQGPWDTPDFSALGQQAQGDFSLRSLARAQGPCAMLPEPRRCCLLPQGPTRFLRRGALSRQRRRGSSPLASVHALREISPPWGSRQHRRSEAANSHAVPHNNNSNAICTCRPCEPVGPPPQRLTTS